MLSRIISILLLLFAVLAAGVSFAAPESALWLHNANSNNAQDNNKSVAIIQFINFSQQTDLHTSLVKRKIKQASVDFGLKITNYLLENEAELAKTVDKIAESDAGLIIIIEPHHMEELQKLPSLYPDIHFSVIGIAAPLYMMNVNSLVFDESQAAFMMGAIAALYAPNGTLGFASEQDDLRAHTLASAYAQGANYVHSDAAIAMYFNAEKMNTDTSNVTFLLDPSLLPNALAHAGTHRRFITAFDPETTQNNAHYILTTMLKRYDLAIYASLKSYQNNNWQPGSTSLGVREGYVDYTLDDGNKPLLSKELIDQIETIKDYLAQNTITIIPPQE